MLNDTIDEIMGGTLSIWNIHCTFTLSKGSILEIKPIESETELFEKKCAKCNGVYDSLPWIHGRSFQDLDVAFLPSDEQGAFCCDKNKLTLSVSIILLTYNFKGIDGEYCTDFEDLCGFNAIDFTGNAVDAIFQPKAAIKNNKLDDRKIEWKPRAEYTKEFDTIIRGVSCKLVFTIASDRQDLSLDNSSLGTLHSVIRLAFPDRQDVSMIEPCWQAVCTFLLFCTGQFNITNLQIGLWDKAKSPDTLDFFGNITCKINCDSVEDIASVYPAYYRFTISSLGEKVGELFRILNDANTHPILGFLPRTNHDYAVDRNKIRDLCTALEVEYDYRKELLLNPGIKGLVKELTETVKEFRKENPTIMDNDEYNYILGSIGVLSTPARKKIHCIFSRYKSIVDGYALEFRPLSFARQVDTSSEAAERDIATLVKIRNNLTHSAGNTEHVIPNMIYSRLTMAVFCSIFERAGYSIDEIKKIIDRYFRGELLIK